MVGVGIAKDTSLPFALLLSLGSAWVGAKPEAPWHRRLRLVTLGLGGVLAGAIAAGWDYLQFGIIYNQSNLDPRYFVPTLQIQVRFFLGIWLSPNGGVLLFWPTLALLLLLAVVAAGVEIRGAPTWRRRLTRAVPLATTVLVLGGVTLGLSKWIAPMGWFAWGSRLILPWLPATAYLLAWSYAEHIGIMVTTLRRQPAAILVPVALAVATLPQYLVLFRGSLGDAVFRGDAICPTYPPLDDRAFFYQCTVHQLWSKHSVLLDAFQPGADTLAFTLAAVCCLAWVWFTVTRLQAAAPEGSVR
jgi:hypothetical protein